ncbi:MAG: radical SAM protein [Desulfobulbaceae bacterium]|uniref:Radical SAM protein n=1 Tax=Candidatus Desulfatifera sulfidica TaxID=2841691 RepID=A0A8J6N8J6_9BACT|nr:radical SAM protein [Candidatus Desulfatifera sulfidica]
MAAGNIVQPQREDFIPLPEGSELFVLPGRLPVGCNPETGEPLLLDSDPFTPEQSVQAVAAFMSPAHTAIYTSAYQTPGPEAPQLPLFAYTAVGWYDNRFWVTAFRSDPDPRQDNSGFNQSQITRKTRKKLEKFKRNRLIQHLGKCCLTYGCPAARNYFLGRWEAPLPTSPTCNARCLGCISLQPSGCCPSTQDRIRFVPSAQELVEIAVPHLNTAERPIVSFGQGCEGEPLLQAKVIEESIKLMRSKTQQGTINLNSNSSRPKKIARLAEAGLDSLRVSLNSCQEEYYQRYHRPTDYTFGDVKESIKIMKQANGFVSLNYFILPGVTDSPQEFEALSDLISSCRPDLIQLRNLNIDPEWYLDGIQFKTIEKPLGIRPWLAQLKERFPNLGLGYFNPFLGNSFPPQ